MASRPPRVVAIGDGIVDLVTPPMEDFAPGDVQAEVPRFDPLPGGNATNFALQMSSLGASPTFIRADGSGRRPRWTCRRILKGGPRIAFGPSGSASLMWMCFSGMRPRFARSPETSRRFERGGGFAPWGPSKSSSIRGSGGRPSSRPQGSSGVPRSMWRSTTRPDAGTSSMQRMRTRNWRGPPSANRCSSRMPPPPFTCGIDDGRTRPSQRSAASFGDSPFPRQIFTFTYLPLRTPFIWPGGVPSTMAPTASPAQSVVPAEAWEMLGRTDLEAYTSWDFPSQAAGHPGAGDASFNGVTPAGCAANMVRRYSGPGDLVVDPMAGSGTIGDVARALGRRAVSFDLVSRRPHILRADARAWPVPTRTAALAVIDSPYSDNVAYSTDPRCLGRISCRDARFYDEMEKVASEAHRVLRPGGVLGWIIADEYRGGAYTPVGFRLLGVLERRF